MASEITLETSKIELSVWFQYSLVGIVLCLVTVLGAIGNVADEHSLKTAVVGIS